MGQEALGADPGLAVVVGTVSSTRSIAAAGWGGRGGSIAPPHTLAEALAAAAAAAVAAAPSFFIFRTLVSGGRGTLVIARGRAPISPECC